MERNPEYKNEALRLAIVEEAVKLAPSFDLKRGSGHIWQALKNVGISKSEQRTWFDKVKEDVALRLDAIETRKELYAQERANQAVEYERSINPTPDSIHGDEAA